MVERSTATAGNNRVVASDSIDALLDAAPEISDLDIPFDEEEAADPTDADTFEEVELIEEERPVSPPAPKRGLSSRPQVAHKPVPKLSLAEQRARGLDEPATPPSVVARPALTKPAPQPTAPPEPERETPQIVPAQIIIQPPKQLSLLEQLLAEAQKGKPAPPKLTWEEQRACSTHAPVMSFRVTPEMVDLYHTALRNHHAHTVWVPGFGSQLGDWLFSVLRKTYPSRTYYRHPRLYREHKGVTFEYVWTGWYWNHPEAAGLVVWEMTRTPNLGIHRMLLIDPMCLF